MSGADVRFRAMGCEIRLIIDEPSSGAPEPATAAQHCRELVEDFDARLSRFQPASELNALNSDPRPDVPASALLRAAVRAGLEAARLSGGLIDPTLLGELEAVGYDASLDGVEPAPLQQALALAPARRPARPDQRGRWREIEVDETLGLIRRPPGLRFDTGGTGKGLCADLLGERLGAYGRWVADCGGDLRVGGDSPAELPIEVQVENPLTKERGHVISLEGGAVATSGIDVRVWRRSDGRFAHHLLDPSTGEPAWTGLIGATAIGRTAVEAETLSKAALLSGPSGARGLLGPLGGLIVHEDGATEVVGPVKIRPRYAISVPATLIKAAA
jgi:thiamine biosynthesis lipoprotein